MQSATIYSSSQIKGKDILLVVSRHKYKIAFRWKQECFKKTQRWKHYTAINSNFYMSLNFEAVVCMGYDDDFNFLALSFLIYLLIINYNSNCLN